MSKKTDQIIFALRKVSTEQFALIKEPPKDDKGVRLSTNYKFGCNSPKQAIAMFLKISFEVNAEPFILLEVGCHFTIEDSDWENLRDPENGNIVLPKGFASHLMMICMGTSRGVLHSKTENTPYNKYILPLLHVSEMIKDDVVLCIQPHAETK